MTDINKGELEAIRDRTRAATVEGRQRIADEYRAAGASGIVFEYMYRGGWRPASQLAGDGLHPCTIDCGVCYPTGTMRERTRRETRRKK